MAERLGNIIELKHITKTYTDNGFTAVSDFNLEVGRGEFVTFLGPSGCGKTTTLRMIAGLESVSTGELCIGDKCVNDVPPKERDIAMVFQSYALYPHMTVYKNMAFALELRKTPKDVIDQKVREAARILELEPYLKRKPKALSGGQRQRVALGRAMVRDPEVFLLDEPLSNLDAKLRTEMRSQIAALHKRLQTTFVYVTHDQTEAMTMGDRICVMKAGVIQQYDTPQNLYNYPCNMFVAGFIGSPQMNFITAKVEKEDKGIVLVYGQNRIPVTKDRAKEQLLAYVGKEVVMGIRPEDLHVEDLSKLTPDPAVINTHVDLAEMMGAEIYLYVTSEGQKLIARVPSKADVRADEDVRLVIDTEKLHIFDKETEKTICN